MIIFRGYMPRIICVSHICNITLFLVLIIGRAADVDVIELNFGGFFSCSIITYKSKLKIQGLNEAHVCNKSTNALTHIHT